MKERVTVSIDSDLLNKVRNNTENLSSRIEHLLQIGLLTEEQGKSNFTLKQVIKLLIKTYDKENPNNTIINKPQRKQEPELI